MMTFDQYQTLFDRFGKMKVLVIGDVMIDSYIFGKVDRISPEAPVPIVAVKQRINRLGGAANVALNLKSLGAETILCSVIGKDDKQKVFIDLLQEKGLSTDGIVLSETRITTTKFRVIGNNAQMLRVDEEVDNPLTRSEFDLIFNRIKSIIAKNRIDVIVFQDYDKGCITSELISEVTVMASNNNIPVTVDPKRRNFLSYHNATLFKPNLKELREGLLISVSGVSKTELEQSALILHQKYSIKQVMITLSEHGVFLSTYQNGIQSSVIHPAFVRNISDVSGAGDTVISISSLCVALKTDPSDIVFLSNLAGGLVCESVGVVPVDKEKLIQELKSIL